VRGDAAGDDFASMFQVLTRRLKRGIEEQNLPDLLVVDGGKGQLNVARAALKEAGLTLQEVPLAGLAKSRVLEDEERFAARQGFRVAEAWAEKAGPEPVVPQIGGGGSAAPGPPHPPSRPRRSRQKGRCAKGAIGRSPARGVRPGQQNPAGFR